MNKCQITIIGKRGVSITVMAKLSAEVATKQLTYAIENMKLTSIECVPDDPKIDTDTINILGSEVAFFAVLKPFEESGLVIPGRQIRPV